MFNEINNKLRYFYSKKYLAEKKVHTLNIVEKIQLIQSSKIKVQRKMQNYQMKGHKQDAYIVMGKVIHIATAAAFFNTFCF